MATFQIENYLSSYSQNLAKSIVKSSILNCTPSSPPKLSANPSFDTLDTESSCTYDPDSGPSSARYRQHSPERSGVLPVIRDCPSEDEMNENFETQSPVMRDMKSMNASPTRIESRKPSDRSTVSMSDDQSVSGFLADEEDLNGLSMRGGMDFPEDVIYEKYTKRGWLYKKSSNIFLGWQRRYFEIKHFKIYYSKNEEKLRNKTNVRCVNLQAYECSLIEHKGTQITIKIEGVKSRLKLKANNVTEAKEWNDFFCELFKFVRENRREVDQFFIERTNTILKSDTITEKEFLAQCQSGDILLF